MNISSSSSGEQTSTHLINSATDTSRLFVFIPGTIDCDQPNSAADTTTENTSNFGSNSGGWCFNANLNTSFVDSASKALPQTVQGYSDVYLGSKGIESVLQAPGPSVYTRVYNAVGVVCDDTFKLTVKNYVPNSH